MVNCFSELNKWDHWVLPWKSASSLLMNRVCSPARVLKASAGEEHAGKSLNVTSGRFEDLILLSMLFHFCFFTKMFALSCHVPSLPISLDSNKIASLALCCHQLVQHHLTWGVAAAIAGWSCHIIWLQGFNGLISRFSVSVTRQSAARSYLDVIVWSLLPGKAQESAKQLVRTWFRPKLW